MSKYEAIKKLKELSDDFNLFVEIKSDDKSIPIRILRDDIEIDDVEDIIIKVKI